MVVQVRCHAVWEEGPTLQEPGCSHVTVLGSYFRLYFLHIVHKAAVRQPHSPVMNSAAAEMSKFPSCHRERERDRWRDRLLSGHELEVCAPQRGRQAALRPHLFHFLFLLWRSYQPVNILDYHVAGWEFDQKLKALLKFALCPLKRKDIMCSN